MPRGRGNNNRGRGSPRGFRGGFRGGRGRGNGNGNGNGNSRGRGSGLGYMDALDFPIQIWPDENTNTNQGYNSPRGGRGRGGFGRGSPHPNSGSTAPRGRGRSNSSEFQSPRGGRGRGRGTSKLRSDAPLSKLLYEERPLLKPVVFVPSVHTRTLFEEQEELLQAVVEDVGDLEENHAPTADRVARVFSGNNIPPLSSDVSEDDAGSEEIEEIDFEDMARIREEVDATTATQDQLVTPRVVTFERKDEITMAAVEEQFTGFFIDTIPTPTSTFTRVPVDEPITADRAPPLGDQTEKGREEEEVIVYVAPHPRSGKVIPAPESGVTLPSVPSESIITGIPVSQISKPSSFVSPESFDVQPPSVSVAPPNPTALPLAPPLLKPTVSSESLITGTPGLQVSTPPSSAPPPESQPLAMRVTSPISSLTPPLPPAPTFESVSFSFSTSKKSAPTFSVGRKAKTKAKKARKKDARAARRRLERQAMFGSFGAMVAESQLRGDDDGGRGGSRKGKGKDPKWEERRRGDSDVDWGDSDSDGDKEGAGVGVEEMDLDVDVDIAAMKGFLSSMSANGGQHVTADDIADIERMMIEDEEGEAEGVGSSSEEEEEEEEDAEEEAVLSAEERLMIAESRDAHGNTAHSGDDSEEDEDEEDSGDEDDDESPRAGFKTRLERLRNNARGKRVADAVSDDDSSDDDGLPTWADNDDNFFAQIDAILDENDGLLGSHNRKGKNHLFRAIHNGDFDDMEEIIPAKGRKDKEKDIPPHLREQWDRDRAKKAEFKRARDQARLEDAADPLTPKKGGKKGRKAMLATARLDPSAPQPPNRIVDMRTLESQIRRFLADIGGRPTMVLPPMEKEERKIVHELAEAFGLKSQSKGKGKGRYTTLSKTTRSGVGIKEGKVKKIVRRDRGGFIGPDTKGKGKVVMPRHKDGDEVGKTAPKIGEANIGFKMLSSMGWSDGDRIGVSSVGLEVPLTAVIKNTKLGLGASRYES